MINLPARDATIDLVFGNQTIEISLGENTAAAKAAAAEAKAAVLVVNSKVTELLNLSPNRVFQTKAAAIASLNAEPATGHITVIADETRNGVASDYFAYETELIFIREFQLPFLINALVAALGGFRLTSPSVAGEIASLPDQAGNGYDFTQADTAKQPTAVLNGFGNATGISFDGGDSLATDKLDFANGEQVIHLIAVVKPDTTSGEGFIAAISAANSTSTMRAAISRFGQNYRAYGGMGDGAAIAVRSPAASDPSAATVVHAVVDGRQGFVGIALDGSSYDADRIAKGSVPATDSLTTTVGSRSGGKLFDGTVGDIIALKGDLSYHDTQNIYEKLAGLYGLDLASPQIFDASSDARGAWTWFNDERVLALGADKYAVGGVSGFGDIICVEYDGEARVGSVIWPGFEQDDHDNPALLKRASDGKILAFFSQHNAPNFFAAVSTSVDDTSSFELPADLDSQLGHLNYSYANAFQLASGRFYLFFRATNATTGDWSWHYSYTDSADGLTGWVTGIQISGADRPYHKFRVNGSDRIDVIRNDGHPNQRADNSTYHFYLKETAGLVSFHKTDGTDITAQLPFSGSDLTQIYNGSDTTGRSWVNDLQLDGSGNPVATFTVYPGATNTSASDIRLRQARWDGSTWTHEEVCDMGATVYDTSVSIAEPFYSGGACGMPLDSDTIYVGRQVDSANAIDTINGVHQIFKMTRSGGGWSAERRTDSNDKSFRPFVPQGGSHLFYLKGRYTTFENFNTEVKKVGL